MSEIPPVFRGQQVHPVSSPAAGEKVWGFFHRRRTRFGALQSVFNGRAFMSRLIWNRHWTLIFALGACLSLATLTPHRAVADPSMGNTGDDNGNIGGGSTGLGDPDVPDGAGKTKTAIKSGRLGGGNLSLGSRAVGDGRDFQGTVMWRLYVAWVGYRSFWLHF